ncbi:hypothetical protein [Longimicrobium sp.]|uniref:hypothetical protein n=1 Tax=Longimicrobium sp. TaxID=2029185 RepID=UPI002D07C042|nr:hypothetical protein [Longimicrobium sp.]HSU13438.1 hypothetical protein [Longimicrobium sp.]
MFEPLRFVQLGQELARDAAGLQAQAREARIRNAYGRLYYGLFLSVREVLLRRHRLPSRRIDHGKIYTHLQNSRLANEARVLGREMQRLYNLRRTADYDLAPPPAVLKQLEDFENAQILAARALAWVPRIPHLDLTPVVHLF